MANTNVGAFIPSTNIYDVATIQEMNVNSVAFKELIIRLYQNLNNVANVVNIKDSGYYNTQEFVNGQLYFPNPAFNSTTGQYPANRQVFRKIINFGTLPNTGTTNVAHGIPITAGYTFTRIYGTASDTTGLNYIPLPYASPGALANNIELKVNATNVTVITGSNRTNFTITYIVLEYIKN